MNRASTLLAFAACCLALDCVKPTPLPPARAAMRGVELEQLTWLEAEKRLRPDAVVVLPIGAASKEHGPHLLLKNDLLLADYFKLRVMEVRDVVVAPTIAYHHYPAFLEYPGSISLRFDTARDLVIDICRSLSVYGPRRFYALNTGVSTLKPLAAAAAALDGEGILLRYTDLRAALGPIEKQVGQQEGGGHADEIETSMMLYIAPESVDMKKAVKDYDPNGTGGLTRKPGGPVTYSPSGIWGDPTLATRAKGGVVVHALMAALLADIDGVRRAPLPEKKTGP